MIVTALQVLQTL